MHAGLEDMCRRRRRRRPRPRPRPRPRRHRRRCSLRSSEQELDAYGARGRVPSSSSSS